MYPYYLAQWISDRWEPGEGHLHNSKAPLLHGSLAAGVSQSIEQWDVAANISGAPDPLRKRPQHSAHRTPSLGKLLRYPVMPTCALTNQTFYEFATKATYAIQCISRVSVVEREQASTCQLVHSRTLIPNHCVYPSQLFMRACQFVYRPIIPYIQRISFRAWY